MEPKPGITGKGVTLDLDFKKAHPMTIVSTKKWMDNYGKG